MEAQELGGGLAGGFEFAGEEFCGRVAGFGLVFCDGAQARQREAACFGGQEGGATFAEALDGVEASEDARGFEEVEELGEGDAAEGGDGGEFHLACDEEVEDLGLGVGGKGGL